MKSKKTIKDIPCSVTKISWRGYTFMRQIKHYYRKGHFIMMKNPIHHENIIIVNIYLTTWF